METQPRRGLHHPSVGGKEAVGYLPVFECLRYLPAGHCYSPLPCPSTPAQRVLEFGLTYLTLHHPGRYKSLMTYPFCPNQRAVEETKAQRGPRS